MIWSRIGEIVHTCLLSFNGLPVMPSTMPSSLALLFSRFRRSLVNFLALVLTSSLKICTSFDLFWLEGKLML